MRLMPPVRSGLLPLCALSFAMAQDQARTDDPIPSPELATMTAETTIPGAPPTKVPTAADPAVQVTTLGDPASTSSESADKSRPNLQRNGAVSTDSLSPPRRKEDSPNWRKGKFVNPEPMKNSLWKALTGFFKASDEGVPKKPLPVIRVDPATFATAPATGLRMTWLGHSSFVLEMDGKRFLVDPVWAERSSPVQWAGPKRWYDPLIALDSLPALDAVLISHNHFDHLDRAAIEHLKGRVPRFVVPLGLAETLVEWGVGAERIVELDWWDSTRIGDIRITSTPARHASGRGLFDQFESLWMGFALQGPSHAVFYSGDTGPTKMAAEIGRRLGPFDLTLIECGQYNVAWPDWHMMPESTLAMHKAVRGGVLIPVHWGLFKLSYHSWREPVERLLAANGDGTETIYVPRPGESVEPAARPEQRRWWEER